MVRLTDRPDMTLDVYRGRKTITQQQQQLQCRYQCYTVHCQSEFAVLLIWYVLRSFKDNVYFSSVQQGILQVSPKFTDIKV